MVEKWGEKKGSFYKNNNLESRVHNELPVSSPANKVSQFNENSSSLRLVNFRINLHTTTNWCFPTTKRAGR